MVHGMSARRTRKPRGVLGWTWRLLLLLALWLLGVAAWIVLVGERDQDAPADAIRGVPMPTKPSASNMPATKPANCF